MRVQPPRRWGRREFMKVVAALGQAAGLGAYDMRSARNRPSRRNKIQKPHTPLTCVAPEIVAQEALYAEGVTAGVILPRMVV